MCEIKNLREKLLIKNIDDCIVVMTRGLFALVTSFNFNMKLSFFVLFFSLSHGVVFPLEGYL